METKHLNTTSALLDHAADTVYALERSGAEDPSRKSATDKTSLHDVEYKRVEYSKV